MAMLHPRFNHLGHSSPEKRNPPKTKALTKAQALHEAWLKRRGLPVVKKRHKLKGITAVDNPIEGRKPNLAPTSDQIVHEVTRAKEPFKEVEW